MIPMTIEKAAKALLNADEIEHNRPKAPTKADLNRKFVMGVGRKKASFQSKRCNFACQFKGIPIN